MTEIIDLNKSFSDDDEDIIELTDILDDALDNGDNDDGLPETEAPDHSEDIIELTDILDDALDNGDNDDGLPETEAPDQTESPDHSAAPGNGNLLTDEAVDEAVEAALSRIIEKKYAQKLDDLFVQAVERIVEREIDAIKRSLLKDL